MASGLPLAPTPGKVNYFAVSILSSRTFWVNVIALIVAILSATEVVVLIPPRYLSIYGAVLAAGNIFLRMVTVRPVALILPGETVPVKVKRIGPPPPAKVTD